MRSPMSLHPAFPIVEGNYRLTREWTIDLPGKFNRRIEDDDLVIWRPGLTFWIAIWGLEAGKTPEQTLAWVLEDASPHRTDEKICRDGLLRLTYRLREQDPERDPSCFTAIYGYVFSTSSHVQIAGYCDSTEAEVTAEEVIRSLRSLPTGP
jgi:hypothetical protein